MGILRPIAEDVKVLVQDGFDDYYICKSVGVDFSKINHIIKYFRKEFNKEPSINIRGIYKSGD